MAKWVSGDIQLNCVLSNKTLSGDALDFFDSKHILTFLQDNASRVAIQEYESKYAAKHRGSVGKAKLIGSFPSWVYSIRN